MKFLKHYELCPHPDEATAIRAIAESGCRFLLNENQRVWHLVSARWFGDDHATHLFAFPELTHLFFFYSPNDNQPLSQTGINIIQGISSLESLGFQNCLQFDDQCARRFTTSSPLRCLNLPGCPLGDVGLQQIAGSIQFEALELSSTKITDVAVEALCSRRSLRYLGIRNTALTATGKRQLVDQLASCEINM